MAWSVPRTWAAGEIVTAAIQNSAVRDNLAFLATFLSTGTLAAKGVLFGSGTAPVGATPALGAGDIVVGGTGGTANPTSIAAFSGTGPANYALKGTYGGLGADVSTGTKGGLLVGSATGTYAVLPVGADGQVLEANSGQALGARWINFGNISLIKSGTGTSTISAAEHTLDSTLVSGLAAGDMLLVLTSFYGTGATAQYVDIDGSATSRYLIARLSAGTLDPGQYRISEAVVVKAPVDSTATVAKALTYDRCGAASIGTVMDVFSSTGSPGGTTWTGTWNIELRTLINVDCTLYWQWSVYRLKV